MSNFVDRDAAQYRLSQYKLSFGVQSQLYTNKPVSERQCNDICCCLFLFILFGCFIGYSGYSVREMAIIYNYSIPVNIQGSIINGVTIGQMKTFAIIMFSCLGGGILASLLLCMLLCINSYVGVMIMAFASSVPVVALATYLTIMARQLGQFSSYFFIIGLAYVAMICSYHKDLERVAILMKTVKDFMLQNCKILILISICLIYCLLVLSLWCLGLYSFILLYSQKYLSYGGFVGSSIFWSFLLVFFNFYFYYTSVFLTSYCLSIWFYQKQDMDPLTTPLKHMVRYHLGSITFASLILSVVNVSKALLLMGKCKNCEGISCFVYIGQCFEFITCCCVGSLEALFQTLNSYAIIVGALTGKSFVSSAETMAHIAFRDIDAFKTFTTASFLVRTGVVIFTSSIPTIIGAILINQMINNNYLTMVGSLLIMFTNTIIGMVILQAFIESVSTLFVIYRFDTQIMDCGHDVTWIKSFGQQLNKGFDEAYIEQIKKKPKPKYKDITTIVVHGNGVTQIYKNKVQVQEKGNDVKQKHKITAQPAIEENTLNNIPMQVPYQFPLQDITA